MGIPCCHAVKIPAGNIVKRWTVDAKGVLPAHIIEHENDKAAESSLSSRQSDMFVLILEFSKTCSRSERLLKQGWQAWFSLRRNFRNTNKLRMFLCCLRRAAILLHKVLMCKACLLQLKMILPQRPRNRGLK
nr:unnamed protein product [Digitaria exilis]